MRSTNARILNRITRSLRELQSHRPLSPSTLARLRDELAVEMTYHSNAIEGNRLTLKETLLVLREGITIKGKNLKEHLEAKNHQEAMDFLFDLVDTKDRIPVTHHLIRTLHQLIVRESEADLAGRYRDTDVQILGSRHRPPPGYRVEEQMGLFLIWLRSHKNHYHPVEFAAIAHHRFVSIHPFEDGNGRTGRLLMNLILMKAGYPIAIIQKNDRKKYYQALQSADSDDPEAFVRVTAQAVERVLNLYLRVSEKSTPETRLVLLSELTAETGISAKYLNLLARKGLLKAQKEGRNWYSSLANVGEYKRSRLRKRS